MQLAPHKHSIPSECVWECLCVWCQGCQILGFFPTVVLNLIVWHELWDSLSLPPPPSCLFYLGFGFLLQSEESEERDDDGEKERNRKRNVRKVKRYYKEKGEREKVRRRDRGEWQMGPKKRGLLGSALRQSGAYDSLTVGSVCVCVCAYMCVSWLPYTSVSVCVGLCVCAWQCEAFCTSMCTCMCSCSCRGTVPVFT